MLIHSQGYCTSHANEEDTLSCNVCGSVGFRVDAHCGGEGCHHHHRCEVGSGHLSVESLDHLHRGHNFFQPTLPHGVGEGGGCDGFMVSVILC